jgi:hypothetical protein
MRSLKFTALLAAFVSGCITSADAYCFTNPSVKEEFKSSDVIIVGTVVSYTNILDSDGLIRGTFYSIRVSEVLKGSPSKTVELYSENDSGRFPMQIGVSYLLFAYDGVFEGVKESHLAIDSCGNSGTLKQSESKLKMVRELSRPNKPPGPLRTVLSGIFRPASNLFPRRHLSGPD